ncbi:hypothetical protein [Sutcliffiella halmapala]|uniref:hypothetical protein n=1 Tax=Sutcliffiella halmapala TaxID=79882 RepID=UPI00099560BC|nr:hypothetical protein [Sutcliffiella halmapala]
MKNIITFIIILVLLSACSSVTKSEPYTLSNKDKEIINSYLESNLVNPIKEGKIISVYDVLGSDRNRNEIYIWTIIEEAYIKGESVKRTSGLSQPLVLIMEENGNIIVKEHKAPRDGTKFNSDIDGLFPKDVREKITNYNQRNLQEQLDEKINLMYQ